MAKNDSVQSDPSRVRMTLDLSARLNEVAERIAREKQTTKADVLRFALELLSSAEAAKDAGMRVGAWTETDQKRTEREFIGL